jgi:hypothetical protein
MKLVPVQYRIDAEFIAKHDAHEILDPVWWSGEIHDSVAEYERTLRPFSRQQRLFHALLWYTAEVNNGGHDQFFWNSTGIVWPDALAALEELKLVKGAAILRDAARRMGGKPSQVRTERQEQLDRLKPDFGDLDDRFYALKEKDDPDSAMTAYIRRHPEPFLFEGVVQVPMSSHEVRERAEDLVKELAPPDGGS